VEQILDAVKMAEHRMRQFDVENPARMRELREFKIQQKAVLDAIDTLSAGTPPEQVLRKLHAAVSEGETAPTQTQGRSMAERKKLLRYREILAESKTRVRQAAGKQKAEIVTREPMEATATIPRQIETPTEPMEATATIPRQIETPAEPMEATATLKTPPGSPTGSGEAAALYAQLQQRKADLETQIGKTESIITQLVRGEEDDDIEIRDASAKIDNAKSDDDMEQILDAVKMAEERMRQFDAENPARMRELREFKIQQKAVLDAIETLAAGTPPEQVMRKLQAAASEGETAPTQTQGRSMAERKKLLRYRELLAESKTRVRQAETAKRKAEVESVFNPKSTEEMTVEPREEVPLAIFTPQSVIGGSKFGGQPVAETEEAQKPFKPPPQPIETTPSVTRQFGASMQSTAALGGETGIATPAQPTGSKFAEPVLQIFSKPPETESSRQAAERIVTGARQRVVEQLTGFEQVENNAMQHLSGYRKFPEGSGLSNTELDPAQNKIYENMVIQAAKSSQTSLLSDTPASAAASLMKRRSGWKELINDTVELSVRSKDPADVAQYVLLRQDMVSRYTALLHGEKDPERANDIKLMIDALSQNLKISEPKLVNDIASLIRSSGAPAVAKYYKRFATLGAAHQRMNMSMQNLGHADVRQLLSDIATARAELDKYTPGFHKAVLDIYYDLPYSHVVKQRGRISDEVVVLTRFMREFSKQLNSGKEEAHSALAAAKLFGDAFQTAQRGADPQTTLDQMEKLYAQMNASPSSILLSADLRAEAEALTAAFSQYTIARETARLDAELMLQVMSHIDLEKLNISSVRNNTLKDVNAAAERLKTLDTEDALLRTVFSENMDASLEAQKRLKKLSEETKNMIAILKRNLEGGTPTTGMPGYRARPTRSLFREEPKP
jgi:hypothetical protein